MSKNIVVKNFDRVIVGDINVNPVRTSNRLDGVKDCFDDKVILAKELPIIYKHGENLKNKNVEVNDKKGPREYYVFESNQAHSMWQGGNPDDYYFNELVRGNDEARLVFDFDIKKSEQTLFEWDEESDNDALNAIKQVMIKLCEALGIDEKYTVCSSCREDKISYHIIFPDVSIKFMFIPYIINELIAKFDYDDEDKIFIFKTTDYNETWFDLNIYPNFEDTAKSIRLVLHKKRCNNISLMPIYGEERNPANLYIRHNSELEHKIEEVEGNLVIDDIVLCQLKKIVIKQEKVSQKFIKTSIDSEQLSEILSHLHNERRKYYYRVRIMFAIYNTVGDDGLEIFRKFLSSADKDRSLKGSNEWAAIKDDKRKCTLGTIFYYLKEDDETFYYEIKKNYREDPIKLYHDIGYFDITYDTLYDEIATNEYILDIENNINEISRVFYLIKACIAMFKTPDTYYRLKRVMTASTGTEVVYQNTKKIDPKLTIRQIEWYRDDKNERKSKINKIKLEKLIGLGVKLGIMHNFITFYPSTEKTKDLNTFTGLIGSINNKNSVPDVDDIIKHIKVVMCKNNQENYEYFMNWLTHIVKKPWQKTGVVPILIGEQGVGKSILFENLIVPYVIGGRYCKTIDNIQTLKDKHFGLSETLLLRFEEALFSGDKEAASMLKQKITGKTHIVNEKFQPIREVESYLNIVIISNNEHCLSVDVGDRRYLMLECDNVRKGEVGYFDNLAKHFTPEGGRAFYKYLMDRELKFITMPPTTELKARVIEMSKDKITTFMDEFKSGNVENVRIETVNGCKKYVFTAEDLLKRINDQYMTKPKMKSILEKSGWVYSKIYIEELGKKGQFWRYTYNVPNDPITDACLQEITLT